VPTQAPLLPFAGASVLILAVVAALARPARAIAEWA
jgi:hypothetical protein